MGSAAIPCALLALQSVGGLQMFSSHTVIFSLIEIKRSYPGEWVAIAVQQTDADGLPSAGEVLVHDAEERSVWQSLKLGEGDDLLHVFYTGNGQRANSKGHRLFNA
jgi:hypothetical protein